MYNDMITLFNRYKGLNGDLFYPTVLHGVDLNIDKAAIIAKYGEQAADNARLHIKYAMGEDGIEVCGKKYLPPKEWEALDEPATTITFDSGTDFDFFIVGEWEDTEPIEDNGYLDGFYDYVNTRYDHVFAITSVARYSVIPHFEIMAR